MHLTSLTWELKCRLVTPLVYFIGGLCVRVFIKTTTESSLSTFLYPIAKKCGDSFPTKDLLSAFDVYCHYWLPCRRAFRSRDCLVIIYGSITTIGIAFCLRLDSFLSSWVELAPSAVLFYLLETRLSNSATVPNMGFLYLRFPPIWFPASFSIIYWPKLNHLFFALVKLALFSLIQYKYYTKIWVPCQELFFVCSK